MQIINNENVSKKQLTVPVIGCPRGGTSMVTGTLISLGVCMGEDLANRYQLEDAPFRSDTMTNKMLQTVSKMDEKYNKWGFKYPNSVYYMRQLIPNLRNPHPVFIFRNHLSIAESSASRDKNTKFGPYLLSTAYRHETAMTSLLSSMSFPAALYSFEAALAAPKDFIDSLIEFLHITPTQQQIQKAMDWISPRKGYQDISTFEAVDGHGKPIRKDGQ